MHCSVYIYIYQLHLPTRIASDGSDSEGDIEVELMEGVGEVLESTSADMAGSRNAAVESDGGVREGHEDGIGGGGGGVSLRYHCYYEIAIR